MNVVMKTLFERRSCRSYDPAKKIREEELFGILKAGTYAPSAMNAQAWHFTVVEKSECLDRLNQVVFEQTGDADRTRIKGRAEDSEFNFFYRAPVLVIVSCDPDASLYPESDCACALENIFLAATSFGIGSCWINQLRNTCMQPDVRAVLSELGVPEKNRVYGCAALGYALKESPLKDRAPKTVNFVK